MQKFAITCIAACAVFGVVGTANAQMHGASHAGEGGFHDGGASHGGGGIHHDRGFHGRGVFIGPPIILGPGYDPYGYSYPYGDYLGSIYWYCPDPAGYYPDVQTCPSAWLQVVPNG